MAKYITKVLDRGGNCGGVRGEGESLCRLEIVSKSDTLLVDLDRFLAKPS